MISADSVCRNHDNEYLPYLMDLPDNLNFNVLSEEAILPILIAIFR